MRRQNHGSDIYTEEYLMKIRSIYFQHKELNYVAHLVSYLSISNKLVVLSRILKLNWMNNYIIHVVPRARDVCCQYRGHKGNRSWWNQTHNIINSWNNEN